MKRILFVFNDDRSIVTHRLHLIQFAINKGYEVGVVAALGRYKSSLLKLDIKVYDWATHRGSQNPIREFLAIRNLLCFVNDFKPEIIHAVAIKPIFYSSALSKFGFVKAKLINNFGGLGFVFRSDSFQSKMLRLFIEPLLSFFLRHKSITITVQNSDDRAVIGRLSGLKDSDIYLLYGSGVDLSAVQNDTPSTASPMVMFMGRLLHEKGIKEFVQAAKIIKRKRPAVRFIVVGDRDEHNPASVDDKFIQYHKNENITEFWGQRDNLNEIFPQVSIVCLPSYHEGMPRVLIEASAYAKPIVTFNVPGCRDVLMLAGNGILVERGDQTGLEEALLKLIDKPDEAVKLGKMGRAAAELHFSAEVINEKTQLIWNSAVSSAKTELD